MNSARLKRLEGCKLASRVVRASSAQARNTVLERAAELLEQNERSVLLANRSDLRALPSRASPAFRDRLTLDARRIAQMGESLRQVARLPDPVGETVESRVLPNGLKVRRERSPLGVIYMIFESRPNVATEAFSLAFKSGNVAILRGGSESMRTTRALYAILSSALDEGGFPRDSFWGITDPDRALTASLLGASRWIDVVVPRGGDKLIEYVTRASRIPIIKNDRGMCHVYAHSDADLTMATRIVVNAKTQRPGVCNAMETLLVHESLAPALIPRLHDELQSRGVLWHGCPRTLKLLKGRPGVQAARARDWDTEYLDLEMNCRVVTGLEEALAHIEAHGSRHSEAIVTADASAARRFIGEVDAAAAYWNASTRFTDGFELGLGGELGISTQKLHVRGPVGLRELTSPRWIIEGEGQIRS